MNNEKKSRNAVVRHILLRSYLAQDDRRDSQGSSIIIVVLPTESLRLVRLSLKSDSASVRKLGKFRLEPHVRLLGPKDERYAVMHGGDALVGLGGDDREHAIDLDGGEQERAGAGEAEVVLAPDGPARDGARHASVMWLS